MKVKLLAGLALTSMISVSVYALEIKNGKLLKHKTWSEGTSLTNTYVNKTTKHDLASIKNMLKQKNVTFSDNSSMVYSAILPATGKAGQRTDVNGYQFTYIVNESDGTQIYMILNSICAQTSSKTMECMYYADEIQLDAYGMAWDMQEPLIQPIFQDSGTSRIMASTMLAKMDDNEGFFTGIAASTSEGFASIS
jgi:hypothetical protein